MLAFHSRNRTTHSYIGNAFRNIVPNDSCVGLPYPCGMLFLCFMCFHAY